MIFLVQDHQRIGMQLNELLLKFFNVLQNQKLKNQLTISSDEYFQNSADSLDNLQRRQQHSCN